MIEEITIQDSVLRKLDPRNKIIIVFLFSVLLAVSRQISVLIIAFLFCILISITSKIDMKQLGKRLIPVNTLNIFLWLFLPFTYPGLSVFRIGPLEATSEGILYAIQITIKSNAMMMILIALIASTPISIIGQAMSKLGFPDSIIHIFFFTYRYIHVIYREYIRLVNSMKIRGFEPGTNLHTYKTVAYMIGMILVHAADRAQRVHQAMLCRGFTGQFYSLREFTISRTDKMIASFSMIILMSLAFIEWWM